MAGREPKIGDLVYIRTMRHSDIWAIKAIKDEKIKITRMKESWWSGVVEEELWVHHIDLSYAC